MGSMSFWIRNNKKTDSVKELKIKSNFWEEYILNHTGCLLRSKADSIAKKNNHQIGREINNLNVRVLILLVSIT